MAVRVSQLATALEVISSDRHLRTGFSAIANRDAASSRPIQEIPGDLIPVASSNQDVLLSIPFHTIPSEGDRSIFFPGGKPGPVVSGKPVVHDETIPSPQAQAVSLVVSKHRVSD